MTNRGRLTASTALMSLVALFPGETDRARETAVYAAGQSGSATVALVGGTLIDGTGAAPIRNSVVLIRGERIERAGSLDSLPVPAEYSVVSTEGMTVLPGLWDMHVHLLYSGHTDIQYWHRTYTERFERETMPAAALQLLQAGVTSARDLGAPPAAVFAMKRRTAQGTIPGPTIYAAGPQLTHEPPDWARFYRRGMSGPEEARARAREQLDAGADVLKITDAESMTVDEIRAITAEAHARGKRVTAHGRTDAEIMIGLEGGVDEFQHIGVAANDSGYAPALLAAIRTRVASGRPFYWTPTVGLTLNGGYMEANRESLDAPENYVGLPALVADDVKASLANFRPRPAPVEAIRRKVSQLREAGVQLLVGTDGGLAGNFHRYAMSQELDAWVNVLGMDPLATIHAATGLAASVLGVERDSGTVAGGKVADIIVVAGDPLRHVSLLRAPAMVFKKGVKVK